MRLLLLLLFALPVVAQESLPTPTRHLRTHDGEYRGRLGGSRYHPDSIDNPYGRYGSEFSRDSIRNPYSRAGSRYSRDSPNNPYGRGLEVWDEE